MARTLAPQGLTPGELSWCLEGFCQQWAHELHQYIVWTHAKGNKDGEWLPASPIHRQPYMEISCVGQLYPKMVRR